MAGGKARGRTWIAYCLILTREDERGCLGCCLCVDLLPVFVGLGLNPGLPVNRD